MKDFNLSTGMDKPEVDQILFAEKQGILMTMKFLKL